MAINRTIIPIPPSHCINERQKRSDFGISNEVKIVAPVVVIPDTASKNESIKLKPLNKNGIHAISPNKTHAKDATTSASVRFMSFNASSSFACFSTLRSISPTARDNNPAVKKAMAHCHS